MIWRVMGIGEVLLGGLTMGHLLTLVEAIEVVVVDIMMMAIEVGHQGTDTRVEGDTSHENRIDTMMTMVRAGIMIGGMVEVIGGLGEATDTIEMEEVPS